MNFRQGFGRENKRLGIEEEIVSRFERSRNDAGNGGLGSLNMPIPMSESDVKKRSLFFTHAQF